MSEQRPLSDVGKRPATRDPLVALRDPVPSYWRHRLDPVIARLEGYVAERLTATVALGIVVAVAVSVTVLVIHFMRTPSARPALELTSTGTAIPMVSTTTTAVQVVVHAAGAVVNPGVYRMSSTSRVADLIESAGGFTQDADTDRINLAAPLGDGSRLYVPRKGESDVPVAIGPDGQSALEPDGSSQSTEARPLNLNTAKADELDELPGIGPATAAAIVDHRTKNGPFRSVDGLLEVRGIGPAKLEALRGLVTV